MKFPTLYKQAKSGSLLQWRIASFKNKIVTIYGTEGCKTQRIEEMIKIGKNLGKKNETTPTKQAELEAGSRHRKQIDDGYTVDKIKANNGVDDIGVVAPMLAEKWCEKAHKIKFPAYASPKLDGLRMLAVWDGHSIKLYSRGRKPINSLPHIVEALEIHCDGLAPMVLDGEAYAMQYARSFKVIQGIVMKKNVLHPEHLNLEYHIFDIATTGLSFVDRLSYLKDFFKRIGPHGPLVLVNQRVVRSADHFEVFFKSCLKLNFEGAMIRNALSPYAIGRRTVDLQKHKETQDIDLKIIGINEGKGKLAGHVGTFTCDAGNGKTTKVKMSEPNARLKEYWKDHSLWKGKWVVVELQDMTDKNDVPRFGRGKRLRESPNF